MSEETGSSGIKPHIGEISTLCVPRSADGAGPSTSYWLDSPDASLEVRAKEILLMDRSGLITDVDGTISRIVSDPASARIDSEIVDSVTELIQHLSLVALLSGRSIGQLQEIVDIDGLVYVGNHGMERWEAGRTTLVPGVADYQERMTTVLSQIRREVSLQGVIVEHKGITATIHYRLCPDHSAARRAILSASLDAASAANLRVSEGRKSVNILPNIPFDKGTAAEMLVLDRRLEGVIYLGDDSTDVDAFRALRRLADSRTCQVLLVGVCVPESPYELHAEADFCLPGVDAVAIFLQQCSQFWAGRPVLLTDERSKGVCQE